MGTNNFTIGLFLTLLGLGRESVFRALACWIVRSTLRRVPLKFRPPYGSIKFLNVVDKVYIVGSSSQPLSHFFPREKKVRRDKLGDQVSVVHIVPKIQNGGAELQLLKLSIKLARMDRFRVFVLSYYPYDSHMMPWITIGRNAGITFDVLCEQRVHPVEALKFLVKNYNRLKLLRRFRLSESINIITMAILLHKWRADALHAWLDSSMLEASTAGLISNVGNVLLMGRNVAPCNFPHFYPYHAENKVFLGEAVRLSNITLTNNSDSGARSYAEWLGVAGGEILKIPNFLSDYDIQLSREAAARIISRSKQNIILGVFRLSVEKRPDDYIAILKRLCDVGYRVKGIVVGDGADRQHFRTQLSSFKLDEAVDWYPHLTRKELFVLYRSAYCSLLCSEEEGFPNVLMEAQLNACPIVASNVGGVPEVVDHGNTGFLYPCGDLDRAMEYIRSLLDDPDLRNRLGRAAQSYALAKFQSSNVIAKLNQIYSQ